MRTLHRSAALAILSAATLLAAVLLSGPARAADPVPVPDGYRMTDYRSPTPAALPGAVTVDTAQARALIESGEAVPINVLKLDRSTLPGGPWIVPKPFQQIPGSAWLPNVGLGALTPELEDYLRGNLELLTKGDRTRGMMFYCLADCWMSWNAAKRALEMGYGRVYWYRDGVDGWAEAGLPTEEAKPVPVRPVPVTNR
ncbi:PQQ-dependent catabolism-associated CXXCW motif protein [Azospirillum sp. sgz302134]